MELPKSVLKDFAEITNDDQPVKADKTYYGTVVELDETIYVRLDGSSLLTPVIPTVEAKTGDRVTVIIKDHAAIITGNISVPALTRIGDTYTRLTEEGVIVGLFDGDEPQDAYTVVAPDGFYVKSSATRVSAYFGTTIRLYKPGTNELAVNITSSGATFTGNIETGGGHIGGWDISSTGITKTTGNLTVGMLPGNNEAGTFLYVRDSSSGAQVYPFAVYSDGRLIATKATITGAITATSGSFGNGTAKIQIGTNGTGNANSSIYYGMSTLGDTTNNGFYLGTDGFALGKGNFKVTSAGALTTKSGNIAGWTINANKLSKTTTIGNVTYGFTIDAPDSPAANKGVIFTSLTENGTTTYPFVVRYDGSLTATKASITGTISSSTITASTITGSSLTTGVNEVTARTSINEMDGVWSDSPFSGQYWPNTDSWYGASGNAMYFRLATKVEDKYTVNRTGLSGSLIGTLADSSTKTSSPRLFGWAHGWATKNSLIVGGRLYAGDTKLKSLVMPLNKISVHPSDSSSDTEVTTLSSLLAPHAVTVSYSSSYITGGIYAVRVGHVLIIRLNSTLQSDFAKDANNNFTKIAQLSGGNEYPNHQFAVSDSVFTSCNPTNSDARVTVQVNTSGEISMFNHSSGTVAKGMIRCELMTYCSI